MKKDRRWQSTGRPKRYDSVPAAKLLRCLQLIRTLERRRMTTKEIAELLDMSTRSVYRYVALFEEAGLIIDKDFNKKFFITKSI